MDVCTGAFYSATTHKQSVFLHTVSQAIVLLLTVTKCGGSALNCDSHLHAIIYNLE